jgi:hypothetical protein
MYFFVFSPQRIKNPRESDTGVVREAPGAGRRSGHNVRDLWILISLM